MTDKTKGRIVRSRDEVFEAYDKAISLVKGIGHSQEHDCAMLAVTLLIVEALFDIRDVLRTKVVVEGSDSSED